MKNLNDKFYVVCPWGFGHSGSGVYVDLMTEISNSTVVGIYDYFEKREKIKDLYDMEVNFFRGASGVLDLENAFSSEKRNGSLVLNNFISSCEYLHKYCNSKFYDDTFIKISYDFIDKIIESKELIEKQLIDSSNTSLSQNRKYYYILKNIGLKEYRKIAKNYIYSVLVRLNPKKFLVLDQFVTRLDLNNNNDYICNITPEYLDNLKILCSYRDPRDVYVTGVMLNETWIPKDKELFVKWFKSHHVEDIIKIKSDNFFVYRFEEMVLNYDNFLDEFYSFLGINKELHVFKKRFFDPFLSSKNIGLYKNYNNIDSIKYIENNLPEFCFYN